MQYLGRVPRIRVHWATLSEEEYGSRSLELVEERLTNYGARLAPKGKTSYVTSVLTKASSGDTDQSSSSVYM